MRLSPCDVNGDVPRRIGYAAGLDENRGGRRLLEPYADCFHPDSIHGADILDAEEIDVDQIGLARAEHGEVVIIQPPSTLPCWIHKRPAGL